MIRGLYTSGWSMMAIQKKMDVVSNNLANVNTNGYKKDTVIFEAFPDVLTKRINDTRSQLNPSGVPGQMQLGSDVGEVFTYFTQGQLNKTNNNFDMAIADSDNAFFSVNVTGADGTTKEYYTRDGSFTVRSDGHLVTKDGFEVLGKNGPIVLKNADFSVSPDGTVVQNGAAIDKLAIKEFTDTTTLRKVGTNLLETTADTRERNFSGTVQQGYLELSNVNVVREMVDMISVMRSYEANQKVLQAQDSTLEKAVNEIGSLR